jgi:hypothetical protein
MSASATLPGDWERLQPRLSPSQEALLSAVAGEWAQIVVARGPVDRVAAEAGVRSAYRAAGLEPPETVIWLDSPLAGAVAAGALTGLDIDAVARDQVWDQVRAAFEAQGQRLTPGGAGRPVRSWIGPLVWSEVRVEVEAQLGRQLWALLWERTGLEVWQQLPERMRTQVVAGVDQELDSRFGWRVAERLREQAVAAGQPESAWCAIVDGLCRVLPHVHGPERLTGLLAAVRAAGWWWPFERAVIMTERPLTLHLDGQGRLHRPDGPASTYPDGFALYAWHGLRVPAWLIDELPRLRVQDIQAQANVELRRVMLESYGFDRYMHDAGATRVHQDDTGTLWRAEFDDDQPLVMVEVVNATPEPDGTHRIYWLRVPPTVGSAREAVAWTFGLNADRYRPLRET